MSERLVVVGAGGFGREVIDLIEAVNRAAEDPVWDMLGVVDDEPSAENLERLKRRGVQILGGIDEYLASATPSSYLIGIGSPQVRKRVAHRFDAAGHVAATMIHPTAVRGSGVAIGPGSIICAGVSLTTNIHIGRHVHLNPGVTVGHDTVVGEHVSINPHASISGDCRIEELVLVGVAGVVLNGLTVGSAAVVGGSACVVQDVEPGATVVGVPARPIAR